MKTTEIKELYDRYVMPTYLRVGIAAAKGQGSRLWDVEGRQYLDFFPGWGVDLLGHCPPPVRRAVTRQLPRLIHVSNGFYHEPQARLAQALVTAAFPGKVFFCNSGAEAVEGAIKLSRRWGSPKRWEIITMQRSFHGRTLAALAATGQPKYHEGFEPLPTGFVSVPFNDLEAVTKAITPRTVAVMLEPIQGEGGIQIATPAFLKGLRALCDRHRLLLICDEVQTGMGRTGTLFAFQYDGITPDILLLAKGLAGGLPMGAMLARRPIADTLTPGTHATTFGGSPLVCAGALAVLKMVRQRRFLARVQRHGQMLLTKLQGLRRHSIIKEIRGRGLMLGIELTVPGAPVVEQCRRRGLLINCTQEQVLRLLPALTVTTREINQAVQILDAVLGAQG